jgi:peptide/nickel transport system substrate-binding protein
MVDPLGWILGTSWLFTGYSTHALSAQYDAYNATASDEAKEKIIAQVQDEGIQSAQAIPLADLQVLQAVSPRVHGFASAPWGLYYWDPIWLSG